jgi:signal peptidase II
VQVPRGTPPLNNDEQTRAPGAVRLLGVAAVIVAFDQITKAWAVAALSDGPIHVIGPVDLELTRNPGGAFSTFTRATPVLAALAVALTIVLIRLARRATDPWTALALALVLGGAAGNLADRVFRAPGFLRGHVVDFVRAVSWWPTFNVADAAITVGAVLLFIRGWRSP